MIKDRFSLSGKVAIVTGGGRGIGRTAALSLAEFGADVVVTARTTEQVEQVAKQIREMGRKSLGLTIDVSKVEDIDRMVKETVTTFGRLDVLVNCAGISPYYTRSEKVTPAMWDELMAVNLRGLFFACQAAGRVMIQQRSGAIVNVASVAGVVGSRRLSVYSASKAGAIVLTKTLAAEWAEHKVRVNAIAPGWVATDFTKGMRENPGILDTMLAKVPLGRVAEAEEIAGAIVYLASDASSYTTGETIVMDGGSSLSH